MKRKLIFTLSIASLLCLGSMAGLSSCETLPTTGGGSNLEDSSKYHVTLPQDEKIEIKGIVSDGYEAGSTVTFTVTVKAENKIIKEVKAGQCTWKNILNEHCPIFSKEFAILTIFLNSDSF